MVISRREFIGAALGGLTLNVVPRVTEQRIGVAVIGLGDQGLQLLTELLRLQSHYPLDVIALCDLQSSALNKAASLVPAAILTSQYEAALSAQGVNALMIATPDSSHSPIAEKALLQGHDLYVEPPLARSSDDIVRLKHLAEHHHAVIQLGMHELHQPLYHTARRILQSQLLGKISRIEIAIQPPQWRHAGAVDARFDWEQFLLGAQRQFVDARVISNWALFREFSDGPAIAALCYKLELLRAVMGIDFPTHISAAGGNFIWKDLRTTPDSFQAILTYAEGFLLSFSMRLGPDCFSFYGTQGVLDLVNREIHLSSPMTALSSRLSETLANSHSDNSLRQHIDDWLASIQYRRAPLIGMEAALRQVRLSKAIMTVYAQNKRILWD